LKGGVRIAPILLLVCALDPCGSGQAGEPPAINPESASRVAQAVRIERAPRMDGTLGDPIWQQAIPITDFRQREPYEGQPATERTEVRVLYSRNEIYFGIACHDTVQNGTAATQLRRDVTQEFDDYFEIVIDARRDRRNAYVFQINPRGTQRDALITDEQAGETQDGDPGWDGVWTSEAKVTPEGWTATVTIPFATLNFMRSHDVVWGLNFKRFIRRKNEEDLWSGWRRTFGANKISEAV
jgi:cellulose/xylan binding protein with CBM9 domain